MLRDYRIVIVSHGEGNDTRCMYMVDNTIIVNVDGEGSEEYDFMFGQLAMLDGVAVTDEIDIVPESVFRNRFKYTGNFV